MGKKQYLERIAKLEEQVRHYQNLEYVSAVIKKTGLPKCESALCRMCEHAAYTTTLDEKHPYPVLIGCVKDIACEDFAMIAKKHVLCPSSQQALLRG